MNRLTGPIKSAANWLKLESKRGVSAIEYGLLAALIGLVIIGGVTTAGANLKGVYQAIAAKVHS
jgi:pilus assembly protein Flp/PilA